MIDLVFTRIHGPIPSASASQSEYDEDARRVYATKVFWGDGRREKYLRAGMPADNIFHFLRGTYVYGAPADTSGDPDKVKKAHYGNGDWGNLCPELFEFGRTLPDDPSGGLLFNPDYYGTYADRVILAMERVWKDLAFTAPVLIDADAVASDVYPDDVVRKETEALLRLAGLLHEKGVKVIMNRTRRYQPPEIISWLRPQRDKRQYFDGLVFEHVAVEASWEASSRYKAERLIQMLPPDRSLIVSFKLPDLRKSNKPLSLLIEKEVKWLKARRGEKEVTARFVDDNSTDIAWHAAMGRLPVSRKEAERGRR